MRFLVIQGGNFKDDKSEQNTYKIINNIIVCIETGISVVLIDLDQIYQSLYDVLKPLKFL